mmetsp:Transcript_19595/g.54649  ORF Transcript_19595/g.54649 Transcript_19595/m.54649 type:complete len:823 (+) Transcript_19595:345-2813(+)
MAEPWTCPVCTLVNEPKKRRCGACKARKPLGGESRRRSRSGSRRRTPRGEEPEDPQQEKAAVAPECKSPPAKNECMSPPAKKTRATKESSPAIQSESVVGIRRSSRRSKNSAVCKTDDENDSDATGVVASSEATDDGNASYNPDSSDSRASPLNTSMEAETLKTPPKIDPAEKEESPKSKKSAPELPVPPPVNALVYRHVIAGWHDTHTNNSFPPGAFDSDNGVDQKVRADDGNNDAGYGSKERNALHPVINPATNKPSLYYQETSSEALEHAIRQATKIQDRLYGGPSQSSSASSSIVDAASWWSDPHESHRRAEVLTRIADLLKQNTDRLADLEVTQIGRPRKEMRFQLSRLHEWFLYYAALLRTGTCGTSAPPFGRDHINLVTRLPLGVVAQITPFNHPLLIAVKKLAPALAAGNCVVLKPSEQAPASVVELALLCLDAGLPEGVLSVVLGGRAVGAALVGDARIRKVDFTGGPRAGAAIGTLAGPSIGKMTQELGGKAPMIVFAPAKGRAGSKRGASPGRKRPRRVSSEESTTTTTAEAEREAELAKLDAYLDPIVNGCAFGAFIASGQTCIAGTRLLVQKEIYSVVCQKLKRKIETVILKEGMGDPFAMTTTFGPMIQKSQMELVHSIVTECTTANSRLELLCGGKRYLGFKGEEAHLNEGNWYEPTLVAFQLDDTETDDALSEEGRKQMITDLHHNSPLFQTELFGPVLGILPFDDEEQAIRLANDSSFSLGCSIWTHDLVQAHQVAGRVRAGIIWINDHHKNAPASPWGGLTRESGVGKENGTEALADYSQAKSLVVRTTPFDADWFRDPNARYN